MCHLLSLEISLTHCRPAVRVIACTHEQLSTTTTKDYHQPLSMPPPLLPLLFLLLLPSLLLLFCACTTPLFFYLALWYSTVPPADPPFFFTCVCTCVLCSRRSCFHGSCGRLHQRATSLTHSSWPRGNAVSLTSCTTAKSGCTSPMP